MEQFQCACTCIKDLCEIRLLLFGSCVSRVATTQNQRDFCTKIVCSMQCCSISHHRVLPHDTRNVK